MSEHFIERKTLGDLHSSVQVPCAPNQLHVNMHTCSFRHNQKHETDRQQTQHSIVFVVCLYFWPACACLNAYANVCLARMADLEPARHWIHLGHLLWQLRGSPTAVGRPKQHTSKLVVLHIIQNLKLVSILSTNLQVWNPPDTESTSGISFDNCEAPPSQ